MSKKLLFDASKYRATKWASAADKAEFADWLCKFLKDGCLKGRWSIKRYHRLSQMFGFIAHYDIFGFWAARFLTPEARLDTVKYIVNHDCFGDPVFTWSDVEQDVKRWVNEQGLLGKYERELNKLIRAQEQESLAKLKEKYPS